MSNKAEILRTAIKVIEANRSMGWSPFHGLSRDLIAKAIKESKQPGAWLLKLIAASGRIP